MYQDQPMKNLTLLTAIALFVYGCNLPAPEKKKKGLREKHNYIVLLDLSDRLVVQENQPKRDKEIIQGIYGSFETKVKKAMYVKSRDEIKVVIAPQRSSRLNEEEFEDRLYVNMDNIKNIFRKKEEEKRRNDFINNLDTLYKKAVYSKNPKAYSGADIWKYFYEDLKVDYVKDTLTQNFLFILTDGYPIVGNTSVKLRNINDQYPGLHVVILEAAPRDKDLEWDRITKIWEKWFNQIGVEKYTLIKRGAISKEKEMIQSILDGDV